MVSVRTFVVLTSEDPGLLFCSFCLEVAAVHKKNSLLQARNRHNGIHLNRKMEDNERRLVNRRWFVAKNVILYPKESRKSRCKGIASSLELGGSELAWALAVLTS